MSKIVKVIFYSIILFSVLIVSKYYMSKVIENAGLEEGLELGFFSLPYETILEIAGGITAGIVFNLFKDKVESE